MSKSARQPQPQWPALGQALKEFRVGQDIAVKEIINRSGDVFTDRTLRNYETGLLRPGRDRLLKLLAQSFDVTTTVEINRLFKLAGYTPLRSSEVQQFGLDLRAPLPIGNPADFRIKARTLTVTDGGGNDLWHYQFPELLIESSYADHRASKKTAYADIDGDGEIETLFVYMPLSMGSVGPTLYCFSETGDVKWEFEPGRNVKDVSGREYERPYFISNVHVVPVGNGFQILVSSNHHLYHPNQIAMLNGQGELVSEYWHSGHLLYVVHADLNGDGVEEIVLGGVNNGFGQASVVIFEAGNVSGVSTQPGRQIMGFGPGTEKAALRLPKTCLSKDAHYNRVLDVRLTRERRLLVVVAEGVSEADNPGVMIYEFDYHLKLLSARPDSHLMENHHLLELEGKLDHSWDDAESQRIRQSVVVTGSI